MGPTETDLENLANTALNAVSSAYDVIDRLQISVTGLFVIGALLLLVFLYATRELATWFFKIDRLKRDLRDLRNLTIQLDREIKNMNSVLQQYGEVKGDAPTGAPGFPVGRKPEPKPGFQISH